MGVILNGFIWATFGIKTAIDSILDSQLVLWAQVTNGSLLFLFPFFINFLLLLLVLTDAELSVSGMDISASTCLMGEFIPDLAMLLVTCGGELRLCALVPGFNLLFGNKMTCQSSASTTFNLGDDSKGPRSFLCRTSP